jgi:hypothetical protein
VGTGAYRRLPAEIQRFALTPPEADLLEMLAYRVAGIRGFAYLRVLEVVELHRESGGTFRLGLGRTRTVRVFLEKVLKAMATDAAFRQGQRDRYLRVAEQFAEIAAAGLLLPETVAQLRMTGSIGPVADRLSREAAIWDRHLERAMREGPPLLARLRRYLALHDETPVT